MIYLELFLTFFKIGAFTFGGGYAMISLIQQQVISHGWLTQEEVLNFIAISESTPGPLAVNMSTFVGSQMAGVPGALCATLGIVLPSFLIILLVARIFEQFQKSKLVKGAMLGLKGVVVGLIGATVLSTAVAVFRLSEIRNAGDLSNVGTFLFQDGSIFAGGILFAAMLYLLIRRKVHPILIIVISAVCGMLIQML